VMIVTPVVKRPNTLRNRGASKISLCGTARPLRMLAPLVPSRNRVALPSLTRHY
jgi:hypothetical protein